MLLIKDKDGNEELLTGYKSLRRFRRVSGEKTLSFVIFETDKNTHSYPMIAEENIVELNNEEYRIKQLGKRTVGNTYYKEVIAVHTFFDLIDDYIYETYSGSMTFMEVLNFVLSGSGYTFNFIGTFYSEQWENIGDDNRLSLFQKILERYGAEYSVSNNHITIQKKVGNVTDFQFRYNHNIKTLNENIDTKDLSTYIKGYGKKNEETGEYLVQSEYLSPNHTVFGVKHAPPIRDERYTTLEGLDEALRRSLKDTPDVSITIDFVDMRRAGFPYDVPNEGDDVLLIYEPMNIDIETRIVDIDEEFEEFNEYPISVNVTLSNFKGSLTDKTSDSDKQMKDIFDPKKGTIRYSVLDAAVKRSTEALQSAQTELEFNNGIIAKDPLDPNKLVVLRSNGIGISTDGGATFKEAITSTGFNLSAGAIGFLEADHITVGPGSIFEDGYDPLTKATLGEDYNGVIISSEDGIIVESLRNIVKLNASDGISILKKDPAGDIPLFTINSDGQIEGDLVMNGGSINWGNVTKPSYTASDVGALTSNSPMLTYIDENGVYTGELWADQIVGGEITGITIQTGLSGNRIVMSGTSLQSYGSDGGYAKLNDGYIDVVQGGGYASLYAGLLYLSDSTNGSLSVGFDSGGAYISASNGLDLRGTVDFTGATVIGINTTAKFG